MPVAGTPNQIPFIITGDLRKRIITTAIIVNTVNLATSYADPTSTLPSLSGLYSTKAFGEQIDEYKAHIEEDKFEGLHSLHKAGEVRAWAISASFSPMSSSQSTLSNVPSEATLPSRRRPLLPPIKPIASNQDEAKASSLTTTHAPLVETRSSNVHDLLNHSDSERFVSKSPVSSHSPLTPGTTLPPVNALTGFRSFQPAVTVDAKTQPFFGRTSPLMLPRTPFPLRHGVHDDGRRGSDASVFSNISPTSSMTSSIEHGRMSPPANAAHHQNYAPGNFHFMTGLVVPVDTQQGSKLADEKRKRNAGASARFRQRRKEKEKEASHSIQRLEARVKELDDLNGWYRNERDHLRQVCISHGLQSQVGPRQASPRLVKMSPNTSTATTPSDWQQQGERGNDASRNQRRRMDYFDGAQVPPSGHLPPHQERTIIAHSGHAQQPPSANQVPRVFQAPPTTTTFRSPYDTPQHQQRQKQPMVEKTYATIR